MNYMSTKAMLREARSYWNKGEPAPFDLAIRLLQEGIDVQFLEQKALDQYINQQ